MDFSPSTILLDARMSAGAVVRTFRAAEWREYRDVRLRALRESPDAFGSTYEESCTYPDDAWIARLRDMLPRTDHPMAATIDDEIVGLAWAKIEPPDADVAHLYQMWVDPDSRGQGIGRALIDSAISWARDRHVARVLLDVTCGDRPARRLYEAVGFRPVGTPHPIREGSDLLEQTMELQLGTGV